MVTLEHQYKNYVTQRLFGRIAVLLRANAEYKGVSTARECLQNVWMWRTEDGTDA